jgi:hypothetical protein
MIAFPVDTARLLDSVSVAPSADTAGRSDSGIVTFPAFTAERLDSVSVAFLADTAGRSYSGSVALSAVIPLCVTHRHVNCLCCTRPGDTPSG